MFDMGFLPVGRRIIKAVPTKRQTMLFSATFPREVEQLAAPGPHHPTRITLGLSRTGSYRLTCAVSGAAASEDLLLLNCSNRPIPASVLIFTRTKHRASRLPEQIEHAGLKLPACTATGPRVNVRSHSTVSRTAPTRSWLPPTSPRAAWISNASRTSSTTTCRILQMPTSTALDARAGGTHGDAFTLVTPEDNDMVPDPGASDEETASNARCCRISIIKPRQSQIPNRPQPARHPTGSTARSAAVRRVTGAKW